LTLGLQGLDDSNLTLLNTNWFNWQNKVHSRHSHHDLYALMKTINLEMNTKPTTPNDDDVNWKTPRYKPQHEKILFQKALQMPPIFSLLESPMKPIESRNTKHIQRSQKFEYFFPSPHKNLNLTKQHPTYTNMFCQIQMLSKSLMNFITPFIIDP
jgi:hypothetical protein